MPNPPISRLTPKFSWSAESGRYRDISTGKYIPQTRVTAALKRVETKARANIRGLSEGLQQGTIALPQWYAGMKQEIKQVHLVNAAVAKGGWAQMTPTDFGRVGGVVKKQYTYLNNFAIQIQDGKQSVNGIAFRADLYGKAGHSTYEATQQESAKDAGRTEEKNVLGKADHCQDCLDETAKGFVPIGTLIKIGERLCTVACRCHLEYRGKGLDKSQSAVYKKAVKAEPAITKDVVGAVRDNGGRMEQLDYRLKTKESFTRKALADKTEVFDVVRYTSIAPQQTYTQDAIATLSDLEQQGHEVVRVTNYWNVGGGDYKGVNVRMRAPDKVPYELQFHTDASIAAKGQSHLVYEEVRVLPPKERGAGVAKMKSIWANVPTPPGVGTWKP
jgi:hypothetical protein